MKLNEQLSSNHQSQKWSCCDILHCYCRKQISNILSSGALNGQCGIWVSWNSIHIVHNFALTITVPMSPIGSMCVLSSSEFRASSLTLISQPSDILYLCAWVIGLCIISLWSFHNCFQFLFDIVVANTISHLIIIYQLKNNVHWFRVWVSLTCSNYNHVSRF